MAYLLDTNIFIESKDRLPMDIYPTFWARMRELVTSGQVFSIEKVKEEIFRGGRDDELRAWVETIPDSFFLPITAKEYSKYAQAISWANSSRQYSASAKSVFASVDIADAFLIATASANDLSLVTFEVAAPNSQRNIKIPDAARAMNVRCCVLNDMLRELHVEI